MKDEVRKLWEICFEDEKAFIDLYFDNRYSDDINIAAMDNGKIIAALQMIPYEMTYYGRLLPVSYISGASTHPDFRSKGVMWKLLGDSHRKMYEKGSVISTLIPAQSWLFDYYSKAGYIRNFFYSTGHMEPDYFHLIDMTIEKYEGQTDVYPYFNRKMMERNCCIQHSPEDFRLVIADLQISEGNLFVAREKNKIIGLAFAIPEKSWLYISEWFADSDEIMKSLLANLLSITGCKKVVYKKQSSEKGEPKGMVRIIHAEKALQHYAKIHRERELIIKLSDEHIELNCGIYLLRNGICTKLGHDATDWGIIHMNMNQLTSLFFKNEQTFMSLMLD